MRIIHPHPAQGSQKFIGVEFIDGFAVVETLHPETEAALVQHKFVIEHDVVVLTLEAHTVRELRHMAAAEGIEFTPRASKTELIGLIRGDILPVEVNHVDKEYAAQVAAIVRSTNDEPETPLTVEDLEQVNEAGRTLPLAEG